MHDLMSSFSFPWYVWLGLGMFLCGILFIKGFRDESDAFLANLLGLKPKRRIK